MARVMNLYYKERNGFKEGSKQYLEVLEHERAITVCQRHPMKPITMPDVNLKKT